MSTLSIAQPTPGTEFWLWPNRFSLQAPLVAVLWQLLLAHCLHIKLDPLIPCALASAVWLIYVADHLVDTTRPRATAIEPPRKEFCRRHWHKFLLCAIAVAFGLVLLVTLFLNSAMVKFGGQVSAGVACYFALIHLAPQSWRKDWPREVVVAAIFTLGTFGPVWLADSRNTGDLLPPASLFMLLCCANCSVIETWESEEPPNLVARWVASHFKGIGLGIVFSAALLSVLSLVPVAFAVAAGTSGVALAALGAYRDKLSLRLVSPLADLALCSPLLLLFLLTR